MNDKLQELERKFERLTTELSDPDVLSNAERFRNLARERASLEPIVDTFRAFRSVEEQIEGNEALLEEDDPELRAMAKDELPGLRERSEELGRSCGSSSFRRIPQTIRT